MFDMGKTIQEGPYPLLRSDKPGISWTLTFRHLTGYVKNVVRKYMK